MRIRSADRRCAPARRGRWWADARAWGIALVLVAGIVLIHRVNPRSLIGFHGLTHTAITYSVLDGDLPPDNPLAAGLSLPYYWVYHVLLAGVVGLAGCPPVVAAEWINLVTSACLTVLLIGLGRWLLGSLRGALLGLVIALFGVHPLGPLLLLCRVVGDGTGLSIGAFARSPAHPMLRDMYLDAGVRWGCGYFFFLQPSSRCVGFLAAMAAAGLVLTGLTRPSRWRLVWIAGCVAFACAMNPIVGTGAVSSLMAALVIVGRPWQCRLASRLPAWRGLCLALVVGAVIALPTYYQLLDGRSVGLPLEQSIIGLAAKGVEVGLFGLLPIILTIWGWRSGRLRRPQLQIMAVAGWTLLVVCWITHVPAGREHSFFNLGVFFLAIPAAAVCVRPRSAATVTGPRNDRLGGWVVAAGIAPVAIITVVSFVYRQPVDLQRDGVFLRDARDPDRLAVYAWIADQAPRESLLITDVRDGRRTAFYAPESEVPAMTRRKLLVDVPGMYMPEDPAVERRRELVAGLFNGDRLGPSQRAWLASLGPPILALCCAADDARGLTSSGFEMVFRSGPHAVYAWSADSLPRGARLTDRAAVDVEERSWPSSR